MKMFVENPDQKFGSKQNYSAVPEISFTRGELNRTIMYFSILFENNLTVYKGWFQNSNSSMCFKF